MAELSIEQQEQVDYIMDNFDFDKVKQTMIALKWSWFSCNGIPGEYELRKCARELLRGVFKENVRITATGGFRAEHNKEFNILRLSFEVTDWEADLEEMPR